MNFKTCDGIHSGFHYAFENIERVNPHKCNRWLIQRELDKCGRKLQRRPVVIQERVDKMDAVKSDNYFFFFRFCVN